MRIRFVVGLIAFSLLANACVPADGQPRFRTGVDAAATPAPAPGPGRIVSTLAQPIMSFDVSPDADVIALATSDGLWLYDFKTRTFLRTLNAGELVTAAAWSLDGSKLAAGANKDYGTPFFAGGDSNNSNKAHLVVWDTRTWKIIFEPQYGNEMVNELFRDLTWSPDGHSLAFSTEVGGVQVVDTLNGQVISRQTEFGSTVRDLAWSPDGSRLLATGDLAYGIRRWRLSDDQSVRLFDPRLSSSMVVAWSPDGERIASGHVLGAVCFWTASTNRCDGFIQAHRTATFSLAWSPGGNELATGGGVIRIWDTHTGQLIKAFGEESEYVYDRIEWPLLGGPLVTLESKLDDRRDTILRLWDVATGSILAEFRGQQQNEAAPVNGSHPIR